MKLRATKGTSEESFVAVDEFAFLQTNACDLLPPEAKPVDPPITTTPNPLTTPAPTEPPGRKNLVFAFLTVSRLTYGSKREFNYYVHIVSNTVVKKFSHAEAKSKQNLSNSSVKTCNLYQVKGKIIWF